MGDLINANDQLMGDDEVRSVRSNLTNTTKVLSQQYRKRKRDTNDRETLASTKDYQTKNGRFSILFVGEWEKEENWKYVDIWYLVKSGIPKSLRTSLYRDMLKRQVHEHQEHQNLKKEFPEEFNFGISTYKNLVAFALHSDSPVKRQIEEDLKGYKHPEGYCKGILEGSDRKEAEK